MAETFFLSELARFETVLYFDGRQTSRLVVGVPANFEFMCGRHHSKGYALEGPEVG